MVRPSFIPPKDLRELRLISCYRQKLAKTLAGEKNRLHKLLDDAGIKLGAVVSDIDGVSTRAMIEGLIEGQPIGQLPELAKGALRTKRDTLEQTLEGELSPRHRLVLQPIQGHIRYLETELANLDTSLIEAMAPYADYWQLLQTPPGIDPISAALIRVEIGTDLTVFSDADHFASWAAPQAPATTSKYPSLVPRKGHKQAIIAVAHKMVRTIFILFTRREAYRDPGIDYPVIVVSKNAPRWIQALKKYGYWPKSASIQTPAPAPAH